MKRPAVHAASERSTHSVSNCCEMRARLAPSADRMENSVARSAVRAIKRFATFVQAIRRISATHAISTSEPVLGRPGEFVLERGYRRRVLDPLQRGAVGPEPISFDGEGSAGLRPRDSRLQTRDGFPAIIAGGEGCGLPDNGLAGIIEPRRRDANDGERVAV